MTGETILLIDTDNETEKMIVSTLETEGYLVFTAPGGDVGATMAEKVGPSLIFVNAAAADSGSLEICKTIHNIDSLKNVPIIILTSYEGVMDPRYTSHYGIVDFLKKPFGSDELIEKTENILAMKSLDVQPVTEEGIESVKIVHDLSREEDRTTIEQEMPDIQKDYPEYKDVSDLSKIDQLSAETEEEQKEKEEEEEEDKEPEETYELGEELREGSKKSRILIPVVVLTLIIIVTAGILLYRDSVHKAVVQRAVVVESPPPVQMQDAEVIPSQEQQKQQQPIEELKPPPVSETVSAPVTAPEPEPAGKTIYSVQLGAFKNQKNAEILAKKYKEKGYEAFIHKGTAKDNEILYRVLIGKFEDRKESSKMFSRIHAKEKVDVTIFTE